MSRLIGSFGYFPLSFRYSINSQCESGSLPPGRSRDRYTYALVLRQFPASSTRQRNGQHAVADSRLAFDLK